jgi:hypothetical protein
MAKVQLDFEKVSAAAGGDKSPVSLGCGLYADMAELLTNRAEILTGKDRDLVMMYLEKGCSMAPLARIAGVSESTIARRIHKLMARLLNGGYIVCLRNCGRFTRGELAVAKDYFLHSRTIASIAANRKVSIYLVRKTMQKVRDITLEQSRTVNSKIKAKSVKLRRPLRGKFD